MVCAGCGHLLLTGYIQNKEVAEVSFENGCRCERVLIYGHSCAPSYRKVILSGDPDAATFTFSVSSKAKGVKYPKKDGTRREIS